MNARNAYFFKNEDRIIKKILNIFTNFPSIQLFIKDSFIFVIVFVSLFFRANGGDSNEPATKAVEAEVRFS